MGVEITGTKVTRRFLGKVTVKCPVCGEVKLIELYAYAHPDITPEAWVYCEKCKSSFTVEAVETPDVVRPRRDNANS